MKLIIKKNCFAFLILTVLFGRANAQTINWENLQRNQKHIINAGFGLEYGVILSAGYSYQVQSKPFPVLLDAEYSFAMGEKITDDFKTKIGARIRWIKRGHFQLSSKTHGVFRRFNNDYTRLINFGADMSLTGGYYRAKWFLAAEAGLDKAVVTHFKHSEAYKGQYPGVVDGWYEPPSGGNVYAGIQTGWTIKKRHDITLRGGFMKTDDFKRTPTIPIYALLGYSIRF